MKKEAPKWATFAFNSIAYLTESIGGGPKHLKQAWVINFHKIFTFFIILGMMDYYDNYSTAAWVYLGLHGIYGYCWLIKDFGFRDKNFENKVTYLGAIFTYVLLVGWYWLFPYLFISRHIEPSNILLFSAVAIHTLGITWMISADCQKHFSLKYRKGLITEGVFSFTRNPNFLGEIFIYVSYAMLAQHFITWAVFFYLCTVFLIRMLVKDASISRYPEWAAYRERSSLLVPWKMLIPSKWKVDAVETLISVEGR